MIDSFPELLDYLDTRGSRYGISAIDLYKAIPVEARDPSVAYDYMELKDISHKTPLSHGGEPSGDNWILEDSSVNRSRGAQEMTPEEEQAAHADAQSDADKLSAAQLLKVAGMGVALSSGSTAVGGAVAAGELAGGAAVAVAEASFITTVVVPAVVTTAIIGGMLYGSYRLYKHLA